MTWLNDKILLNYGVQLFYIDNTLHLISKIKYSYLYSFI